MLEMTSFLACRGFLYKAQLLAHFSEEDFGQAQIAGDDSSFCRAARYRSPSFGVAFETLFFRVDLPVAGGGVDG